MQRDESLPYGDDMLRLDIAKDSDGQISANVQLVWQPTAEAVALLAKAEAADASLLVIVDHAGKERQRQMFPLRWGSTFLALSDPGLSTIHATIVWSDDPKDRSAKYTVMAKRSHGEYRLQPLMRIRPRVDGINARICDLEDQIEYDENGDPVDNPEIEGQINALLAQRELVWDEEEYQVAIDPHLFYRASEKSSHSLGSARISVDVPRAMFATSWPITRFFGYLFMKRPARDNCALRRRAIVSATVSPVLVPLLLVGEVVFWCLWRIIAVVAALTLTIGGFRNLDYAPLIRPRPEGMDDIWLEMQPSRWWTRKVEDQSYVEYVPRNPTFQVINPPVLILLSLVAYGLYLIGAPPKAAIWCVIAPALTLAGLNVVLGWIDRKTGHQSTGTGASASSMQQAIVQSLSYSPHDVRTTPHMPVIRLAFHKAKVKLCKPFAQSG